ncbi:MAG: DUF2294 family protein [Nitriliruptorales bacterium]|nr:DUF2294 family protein [Nitriliruptorales bacterium]
MAITKEQRAAIGEAVMRLERDFYGRGPSSIRVATSDSAPEVITVLSVDSLTAADRTLVDRGAVGAVVAHHEAVHFATYDDFCKEVGAIVGQRPDAYFAQVDPHTGYAVRVFVFDESPGVD